MKIQIDRIYDKPSSTKSFRVLVDRLWPRGVSKERASIDLWAKDIAPTSELRTWFNHIPEKFDEFRLRYVTELDQNTELPKLIDKIKDCSNVTLLYSAKDERHNQAVVLREYLKDRIK